MPQYSCFFIPSLAGVHECGINSVRRLRTLIRARSEMDVSLIRFGFMIALLLLELLLSPTLALAGTGIGVPEANQLFTGWHGTIVGVIIPLAAAGVAIAFIARAVSNARDGASPVGAIIGAIITAGGAMIIPTLTPATAGGAPLFTLVPVPEGSTSLSPTLIYGYLVAKLFNRSRFNGRAHSE